MGLNFFSRNEIGTVLVRFAAHVLKDVASLSGATMQRQLHFTLNLISSPLLYPIQQSLCWHEHRSALVLDQEHQEFGRLGTACVPANDMNIVGAFIEGLSWCQRYLFSTLHLHHNGALQYVNNRMCIVSWIGSAPPGAYSTVIVGTSLPGFSGRSFDMSDVTLGG